MNGWKWWSCSAPKKKADTHLFLHALHAARTGSKAVTAEDTDVILLSKRISSVPSIRSEGHRTAQFVDISKLVWSLGDSICDSLIWLHAFTGCDIVSAFASRGKLSALKLMKKDKTYQETFSQVGQSLDVQPHIFQNVQQFTCPMYVAASSTADVNDLRCQLFCAKRREIESGCYHHADIVSSRTSSEPTTSTRQQSGSVVCLLVPQCPTLPSVDGYVMMASSPFTGCGRHQHQMLSWNCWLVSVSVPVSCQSVHAWQMD